MRRQLAIQLSTDDATRILEILHEIEDAAVRLSQATSNALEVQHEADSSNEDKILTQRVYEAFDVIGRIKTKAQYLKADRYRLLKGYLVLRNKRGGVWEPDEFDLMRYLSEMSEDINEYVTKPPTILRRLKWWFQANLNTQQREILVKATTFHMPVRPWILVGESSKENLSPEMSQTVDRSIADLVERSLMYDDGYSLGFALTRKGWKEAVRLLDGSYDIKAGATIPLT